MVGPVDHAVAARDRMRSVVVNIFVDKISSWFKYYNLSDLDPRVPDMTNEQKKAMIAIINNAAESQVYAIQKNNILTIIENLNNLGLITDVDVMRSFYNQLSEKTLVPQAQIDYDILVNNEIIDKTV